MAKIFKRIIILLPCLILTNIYCVMYVLSDKRKGKAHEIITKLTNGLTGWGGV